MKKVLILKGLPASGKSTFAKKLLDDNPGVWKRLNKDELRSMLDNSNHSKTNEKFVERVRDLMLVEALKEGKHVVIDDTNLSNRPVDRITQVVQKYNIDCHDTVKIEVKEINTSLEESLKRDGGRDKKVGRNVILRMYKQHILKDERGPHYQPQNNELPPAIICDIDGTLAIIHNRSPFEGEKVENDLLNKPVADIVGNYNRMGVRIILMSGREEKARTATQNWLKTHQIPYDALYMRATSDNRKDSIVKKELYNEWVKDKYHVNFVLDDRDQVIDLWRLELGLPCLQVNYGDF